TDDREARAASARFLSERLRPQGDVPRGLAVADQGMFDSQKSGISLINTATVAAIADAVDGRAALGGAAEGLDPLRVRGNAVLDGLEPLAEFALVGSIIRLAGCGWRSARRSNAARRRRSTPGPPPSTSTSRGCSTPRAGTCTAGSTVRSSRPAMSLSTTRSSSRVRPRVN